MPSTPPTLTALLLAASTASAAITIPTVSVGNAGNDADDTGYGAVDYDYRIGTYEVTNSQYTAFLNNVANKIDKYSLYNPKMGYEALGGISQNGSSGNFSYSPRMGMADKPVNYVSFWDSARFANWLTNGQPTGEQGTGTTEDGMYNLGGVTDPDNSIVTRQLDFSAGENGVAVASEDEWYKAAYYKGNGDYYDYPTKSDLIPNASGPTTAANSANYLGAINSVTDFGSYPNSGSYYGTFDQGGNVQEWNDKNQDDSRVVRGGALLTSSSNLRSSVRTLREPSGTNGTFGFRVTSLTAIPEPSSYGAIFGVVGLATAVFFRRRRRRE